MKLDFKKVKKLTKKEQKEIVNSLSYEGLADHIGELLEQGVSPDLILDRLNPRYPGLSYMVSELTQAKLDPEKILDAITVDGELPLLYPRTLAALYNDQTADRLLGSLYNIDDLARFLDALTGLGKRLPLDILLVKTKEVCPYSLSGRSSSEFISRLGMFLEAGMSANDALYFIERLGATDYEDCLLLLEYGVDAKRLAEKIDSPRLLLRLRGELEKHGISLDEKSLLNYCSGLLNDEIELREILKGGVQPELVVEELPDDATDYEVCNILIGAGVKPEALYLKISTSELDRHCQELSWLRFDFEELVQQRLEEGGVLMYDFQEFLAKRANLLLELEHGVDKKTLAKAITDEDCQLILIEQAFKKLTPASCRKILDRLTKEYDRYTAGIILPIVLSNYRSVKKNAILSSEKMREMVEMYMVLDRCNNEDLGTIMNYSEEILDICPDFDLHKFVDRAVEWDPEVVLIHLKKLLGSGMKVDLQRLIMRIAAKTSVLDDGIIEYRDAKLLLESGLPANWFLQNAADRIFRRNFNREDAKLFLHHGANPNLVAYRYWRENDVDCAALERLVGQETIWSKVSDEV